MNALTKAAQDVLAERQRQIEQEGYEPENDDRYGLDAELSRAAASYILQDLGVPVLVPHIPAMQHTCLWPWPPQFWKPKDERRNLVRAAALLVAEIERIDRAHGVAACGNTPYDEGPFTLAKRRPLGCALAMRVMQSDLYQQLNDAERADCDELVRCNVEWFKADSARGVGEVPRG